MTKLIGTNLLKMSHRRISKKRIKKEIVLDLSPKTLPILGEIIKKCVANRTILNLYCSLTINNGNKSMTEIPGVKNLFVEACLQHGLLGYLDWQKEQTPSDHIQMALDNVIIITCGSVVYDPHAHTNSLLDVTEEPIKDNSPIIHEINDTKLQFIRKQSQAKFDQLIKDN